MGRTQQLDSRASARAMMDARAKALANSMTKAMVTPYPISSDLEAIVGPGPLSRMDVARRMLKYMNVMQLKQGRTVYPNAALARIIGTDAVDYFDLTGKLSPHILD